MTTAQKDAYRLPKANEQRFLFVQKQKGIKFKVRFKVKMIVSADAVKNNAVHAIKKCDILSGCYAPPYKMLYSDKYDLNIEQYKTAFCFN